MPIPKPRKDEVQDKFISRCMSNDVMKKDFPKNKQRLGVCFTQWRQKNNMFKSNYGLKLNLETRIQHVGDVDYLIAPVIAIKEGVHNGFFYTTEEISKNVSQWNGVPITIFHPEDSRGFKVSANDTPELMESQVGKLFNVNFIDNALKGELWINKNRLEKVSPECLKAINSGQLEVSIGLFSNSDGVGGVWNDEKFTETVFNFVPDHIALLPSGKGACSWEDGAGVRANQENNMKPKFLELDDGEKRDRLHSLLRQNRGFDDFVFIRSLFNDNFIYQEDSGKLFRQNFSIDSKDQVAFTGDATEVIEMGESVKFVELSQKEGNMISKERVDKLFSNENFILPNTEASKVLVTNMKEEEFVALEEYSSTELETLTKHVKELTGKNEELIKVNKDLQVKIDAPKEGDDTDSKDITVNKEELAKEIMESLTFDQILDKANPELKESIESGIKINKDKKEQLIKSLDGGPFSAEELQSKSMVELEKLCTLSRVIPDFSGQSGPGQVKVNEYDVKPDGSGVPKMPTIGEAMKKD